MKSNRYLWLFVMLAFALVPMVAAQDTPLFSLVSDTPVVANADDRQQWDGRYTDPGAVFYHDGMFHMFRNGFLGWPASVQIGYLTAPDGITWTEVTEKPVLTTAEVPYAGVAALASSALVEDDGTWVLYFYTWEDSSGSRSGGAIGRATAAEPTGTWVVAPEPVLTPGSAGSWDELQLTTPRVRKTDDGYVMYYSGFDSSGLRSGQIGMATSPDGITWTKYDDPSTTDAPYAESDPVFIPTDEGFFVHQPNVVQAEGGWVMVYRQADGAGNMQLYSALSEDGVQWERTSDTPIWTKDVIPNTRGFWFTDLVYHDDTYYLYIEAGSSSTDIYVATYEGSLAAE